MTPNIALPEFRALSYNIRKARGLDGRRSAGRILDIINESDADVVFLQEADRRLGQRPSAIPFPMVESHSDYKVVPVAENDISLGWHGNAVLVRNGLTVHAIDRLILPGLEPRGAVKVSLSNGVSLTGVHLGLTRNFRRRQISTIVEEVRDDEHAIILGDMNEWSSRKGLEDLYARFDVHAPGKTFHASRPIASLDRIGTSRALEVFDAGVIDTSRTRVASDHLPIWADIRIPTLL